MEYKKTDDSSYDEELLQGVLKSELDDAKDYIDSIGQERAESTQYYLGESPTGGSDMSSEYVSTDVRDSVLFMLPSLMRTFFGTKKVVEFIPNDPQDVPVAKQQSDYINYIVTQKNNGFKVLYDVFKDALIRKTGFAKVFFDSSLTTSTHSYTDLSIMQYETLIADENVEVMDSQEIMGDFSVIDEATGEEISEQQVIGYDLTIRRVKEKNDVIIESIPPEEVLISRNARSLKEASYVAHRRIVTLSDLVSMGYDKEEMEEYQGNEELSLIHI